MAISEQALNSVKDRSSLFAFLRDSLGWLVDPEDTFTYDGPHLHGDIAACADVSQIVPFSTGDPYTIMLAEFSTPFRRGDLRAILQRMREDMRKRAKYSGRALGDIIFLCATECVSENYGGIHFVRFEEREGRQPKLSAFGWDCARPEGTRTLRDINLPALAMPKANLLHEADWAKARWVEAWNVEKVTSEFYRGYHLAFDELSVQIKGVTGDIRLFTQRVCNRLLFLQFLSKKGWLNRDRNYIANLYSLAREHAASSGGPAAKRSNFYSGFLHPLFFKALNTATDERPGDAEWSAQSALLGDVPFLNGGLFARHDADDDAGAVTIPNDAFQPVLDLFDRFNFTLTESTPDDVEVAIDAEMLGRVFEELVNADERHSTGSYYTPRGIVSFMCREAIKGYLGGGEAVAAFVDEGDPSGLRDPEEILEALKRVTVCDPACGSGAYLLGMMQELLRLREGLFVRKARDHRRIYDRKLEIIQRNLYGVDKEPFAVNIAMLRLWLSLVVDNDAPVESVVAGVVDVSLPNLKFKIQCGDALSTRMTNINLFGDEYVRDSSKLRALEDEYFAAAHHGRPSRPKNEIEADIRSQQEEIAELIGGQTDGNSVDWCVRFAEVFATHEPITAVGGAMNFGIGELTEQPAAGGFAIVLANPPYVRQELIKLQKPALKHALPQVYNGNADLFTYFYARAVELLAPNGLMAIISSNKWFRAGYGTNLRKHLSSHCRIISITDFGDLPVFQSAIAYPAIFIARKTNPGGVFAYTRVKSLGLPYPDLLRLINDTAALLPSSAAEGGTWSLSTSLESAGVGNCNAPAKPLSRFAGYCFSRGLSTGFNDAFVITSETRDELIAADPRSAELIKPYAGGKHIRRWQLDPSQLYIIYSPWDLEVERYPAIEQHLSKWKTELSSRPECKLGRFNWWCMARYGAGHVHFFDGPKIVSTKVSIRPTFALDTAGYYLGNTSYFLPAVGCEPLYVLGVLNSSAFMKYARGAFVEKQNGWYEVQPRGLDNFPIPIASDDDRTAIAALAEMCVNACGFGCEAWEAEIDERIASLYGL